MRTCIRRLAYATLSVFVCLAMPVLAEQTETAEPAPKAVTELRINGPKTLNAGVNLIHVQAKYEGSNRWVDAKPESFKLTVPLGFGRVVEDISKKPVNPVTVLADPGDVEVLDVKATAGEVTTERRFEVRRLTPTQTLELTIDDDATGHAYNGVGAGAMFYDNQFLIGKELFDWCFKDVDTQFLHVLIRPDYEQANDNDDWQTLNPEVFDWKKSDRLFWICWNARQRNPDLKVYACLYSPPAWMKANDNTSGEVGLKPGESIKLEMAEYVYAFLKRAAWKGTKIDYLCLFNEPDFPHSQDGTYFESLADLAETQAFVSAKVDALIDADPDFHHKPKYVFPETLGPGSITRAGEKSKALAEVAKTGKLDHLHAWGVHDYWNTGGNYWRDRYKELRAFPGVGEKPIWMTEWAQRFPQGDLASGMAYGTNILNSLRLGASVWMAFEWAHPADNQSGLISTQWGEGYPKKRYWRSKSYYVFQQIANTTPADGIILPTRATLGDENPGRSLETLVVKKGEQVVVHLLNSSNYPVRYDISKLGNDNLRLTKGSFTDPQKNNAEIDSPSVAGVLPGYTLITLELRLAD